MMYPKTVLLASGKVLCFAAVLDCMQFCSANIYRMDYGS